MEKAAFGSLDRYIKMKCREHQERSKTSDKDDYYGKYFFPETINHYIKLDIPFLGDRFSVGAGLPLLLIVFTVYSYYR